MIALTLLTGSAWCQDTPKYGSNNGAYVTVDGRKLYYEEYGSGTPLLLLHGGFGSIADFTKVIPVLSKSYRVIAVDSPGHGRSVQAETLSYPLMASYFSKMIDAMKLDSVYVMGWSDGGVVAYWLAADRPDKVKRAIAVGANTKTSGMMEGFVDFINAELTPEVVESGKNEWLTGWKKQYDERSPQKDQWKKFVDDTRKMWTTDVYIPDEKLKSISVPVMVVMGDKDLMTLEHGIEIHRAIPSSEFCVLPNTSHMVFGEVPDIISAIALRFFR